MTRIAAISAAAGAAMLLGLWLGGHGTLDPFGKPIGSDFTAFWHAGSIADSGNPASAWDQALLNREIQRTHGAEYGSASIYPPVFLLIAAPLGAMPYLSALFLWQAVSFAAVALVLSGILKDRRATLVALASPLTPLVLANGQNAFLTAALLGFGLLWWERRPALAGGVLGALIYKPQLGLVIAPLLIATRNWRALAGAAAVVLILVATATLIWGTACWTAWASSLRYGRHYMEQGSVGLFKSASLFSAARTWGAGIGAAYALQAIGTLASLVLVFVTRNASNNVRAASVCAAAALSTPYLLDYDMAVVGIGAAFLYSEAGDEGFRSFEKTVLAAIWAAPWISRPAAEYALIPLGPIAMLSLLWLIVRRPRQGIAIPPLTCSVCPVT